MRYERDQSGALAFALRLQKARQDVLYASRRGEVVAEVLRVVEGASGARMRQLGGYRQVVKDAIGLPPPMTQNSLGYPNEPGWWIWNALQYDSGDIRFEVSTKLQERQLAKS